MHGVLRKSAVYVFLPDMWPLMYKKRECIFLIFCYFQTTGTLQNLVKELYLDLSAFVKHLENYLNRMLTLKLLILNVVILMVLYSSHHDSIQVCDRDATTSFGFFL